MPKVLNPTVLIKELGCTQFWSYVSETKHLVCKVCSFSAKMNSKSILGVSLAQEQREALYWGREDNSAAPHPHPHEHQLWQHLQYWSSQSPFHKIENEGMKTFLEKYTKTGKSQARFPWPRIPSHAEFEQSKYTIITLRHVFICTFICIFGNFSCTFICTIDLVYLHNFENSSND